AQGFAEQRILVAEMAVHGELGDTRLGGDRIHAGAFVAMLREQALRRIQDGGALFHVLGPAGAGRTGGDGAHVKRQSGWQEDTVYYTAKFIFPKSPGAATRGCDSAS